MAAVSVLTSAPRQERLVLPAAVFQHQARTNAYVRITTRASTENAQRSTSVKTIQTSALLETASPWRELIAVNARLDFTSQMEFVAVSILLYLRLFSHSFTDRLINIL